MSTTVVVIIIAVVAVIIALSARSGPRITQITTRREDEDSDDA